MLLICARIEKIILSQDIDPQVEQKDIDKSSESLVNALKKLKFEFEPRSIQSLSEGDK